MNNDLGKCIGRNINTLLAVNRKKQKDLAEYLGVTDNTISYYVSGSRKPNLEQLIKIARFFNTSVDYLLDLTFTSTTDKDLRYICDYTGLSENAVKELRADREMSAYWNYDSEESFCDIASEFISSGTFDKIIGTVSDFVVYTQKQDECEKTLLYQRDNTEWVMLQKSVMVALFELQETAKEFAKDYYTSLEIKKYSKAKGKRKNQ